MTKTRLYPPADPTAKVGIPRDGEIFDADDAKRLVGQGLASRQAPKKRSTKAKPASSPDQEV